MEATDEIYAIAGVGAPDLEALVLDEVAIGVPAVHQLAVGAPIVAQHLAVGAPVAQHLAVGAPVAQHLAVGAPVAQNSVEEPGWTKVVSKKLKKATFKGDDHKKLKELTVGPLAPEETLMIDPVSNDDNEVIWYPKTSSRRATKKWSMARQGGATGTLQGTGFFIYGSYGDNGIEY